MANGSTADKAAKARGKAYDAKSFLGDSMQMASDVAKKATGKNLTMAEERKAGKIIQARRVADTGRTARRADFKARQATTAAKKERTVAAVTGGTKAKATPKATPKAPAKKKVLVMPDKISPSKMTPAQKARYLKNPERYNG
jgi:hypothetical protein